jgi:cytochrome c oxidase subunit 2
MQIDANRRRMLGAAAVLGFGAVSRVVAADERVIPVVARKFVFVPNEIHLRQGESVVLELTAPEVTMGFNVPGLAARADIVPGVVTRVRLTPLKPGRFQFNCDVFCGSGHEDMDGVIVVEAA